MSTRKKPRVYCWVPGCYKVPETRSHYGAGRCAEHRYVPQPSKASEYVQRLKKAAR